MSVYVLVHGAWHGSWCWQRVAALMEAEGHRVFTPTLIGLGERAHLMSRDISLNMMAEEIAQMLAHEELQDVVLVGHSFGGTVISGVADRAQSRISGLIYLDAVILENGEAMFDSLPPEVAKARQKLAQESSGGLSMPAPDPAAFGLSEPEQCEYVRRHLTPHPISTYQIPFSLSQKPDALGPSAYILCTDPIYQALESSRQRARCYGWPVHELATGHDAMISAPEATAASLMKISQSRSHF